MLNKTYISRTCLFSVDPTNTAGLYRFSEKQEVFAFLRFAYLVRAEKLET